MRTTLDIDDVVLDQARAIAQERGISLGAAVSRLALRGMRPGGALQANAVGLPVFEVSADAPVLTPEMVRAALDDE